MSKPMATRSESVKTTSAMTGAAAAQSRPVIVRMLTEDDLPYDYEARMERLKYLRMPTQDDLPYYDGEPMESELHLYQIILFIETLKLHWANRHDFYVAGDMAVYFSSRRVKNQDFRAPDFFLALDVDGKQVRKSWVVWEEGKAPDLVIEFLSDSTAGFDREGKKKIYQDQLRVPEYYYYDPWTGELAGFARNCEGYQPILPDLQGRLVSPNAKLALTRWEGEFMGVTANWLRWATLEGKLLPTKDEAIQHSDKIAKQERARAKQERAHTKRLAERLRALGVDPDSLD